MKKYGFIILIVILIIAFLVFHFMKNEEVDTYLNPSIAPGMPDGNWPVKYGDKNQKVIILQRILNSQFNAGLTIDGDFGPKTDAAAKKAFKTLTGNTAPTKLEVGPDLLNKFEVYTPVDPQSITWRTNTWINRVITEVNTLIGRKLGGSADPLAAQINSMARFSDSQLRMMYQNYYDKFFRSMTQDLESYKPDAGTMDGYKILMGKLNQLNLS